MFCIMNVTPVVVGKEQWLVLMPQDRGTAREGETRRLARDFNFQTHQSDIGVSACVFMNKKGDGYCGEKEG